MSATHELPIRQDSSSDTGVTGVRSCCHGTPPLDARLESWMQRLLADNPDQLHAALDTYGSPLNIVDTSPLIRNASELQCVADDRNLAFQIFFARKANKCLAFVDAASDFGAGVDVASEQECRQVLDRGVIGSDVICTAAIKTTQLLELCVQQGVTIALDNPDEVHRVRAITDRFGKPAVCVIRISGFEHDGFKLHSRFGFDIDEVPAVMNSFAWADAESFINLIGLHFHLDGYRADQRVSAIRQCLPLIDQLRAARHEIRFLDIGGGLPMSYIDDREQWETFWAAQEEAVLQKRSPFTYRNHGLGLLNVDGNIYGKPHVYPYSQTPVRADWLACVLDADSGENQTIAQSLRQRSLQLRCEPGRSLLDGCGMTAARVEFTKRHHSGDFFIGLAMNRTQCRTGSDDFLVDPIVVHSTDAASWSSATGMSVNHQPMDGYLVGAYCTESELISLRQLTFPRGINAGDLVVLPNTAGNFMHFLESRSHQFPLAKNVVLRRDGHFELDGIDQ